jgi:uroporphyrinogen decarboxylase
MFQVVYPGGNEEEMNERDNWLRALEFRNPEWIPCGVSFSPITWHNLREDLEAIVLRHPRLFKDHKPGSVDFDDFPPVYREGEYFRDNWGCLWYNAVGGIEGAIVENPLEDWDALKSYRPPDPRTQTERGERDWEAVKKDITKRRAKGQPVVGDGERLFDRLYFLRGYENLMIDIATDDPHLPALVDMLLEYELQAVDLWLALDVDAIGFHTDIGTQKGLMISPEKFRKYIKPLFRELFTKCRDAGVHVYLSSDGNLLDIVDDLVECGVSAHDPQFRACALDGIVRAYKGRLCANVDLDRQMFAFCKPEDIWHQVEEVVERMGAPEGGLMVSGSISDATLPLENIEALCESIETFCLKEKPEDSED